MSHEIFPIPQLHTGNLLLPMVVPVRRHAWLPLGLTLAMVLHVFGASVLLWAAQFEPYTEPPRLVTLFLRDGGGQGGEGHGSKGLGSEGRGTGENKGQNQENAIKSDTSKASAPVQPVQPELTATNTAKAHQTTTAPNPSTKPEPSVTPKLSVNPQPSATTSVPPTPQPASLAKSKTERQTSPKGNTPSAPTATATNTVLGSASTSASASASASTSSSASSSIGTAHNGNGLGSTSAAGNGKGGGVGNGNSAVPSLAHFTKPAYPRRSRQAGEEGAVLLEAHVSSQGELLGVRVVQSSGYPRLDEAARKSLHKARFAPAMRLGRPVTGHLLVPFAFNLKDDA